MGSARMVSRARRMTTRMRRGLVLVFMARSRGGLEREEAPSSHIFRAPATTRSLHTHGALDILLYYPDIFSFFLQPMQSWAAVRSQTPDVCQSFNICNSPNFKLSKTLPWKKSPETDDCLKHFVKVDTTGRPEEWVGCCEEFIIIKNYLNIIF